MKTKLTICALVLALTGCSTAIYRSNPKPIKIEAGIISPEISDYLIRNNNCLYLEPDTAEYRKCTREMYPSLVRVDF